MSPATFAARRVSQGTTLRYTASPLIADRRPLAMRYFGEWRGRTVKGMQIVFYLLAALVVLSMVLAVLPAPQ